MRLMKSRFVPVVMKQKGNQCHPSSHHMQEKKKRDTKKKGETAPNIAMFYGDSDLGELVPSDNKMLLRAQPAAPAVQGGCRHK
jgi:hypothetical protein